MVTLLMIVVLGVAGIAIWGGMMSYLKDDDED